MEVVSAPFIEASREPCPGWAVFPADGVPQRGSVVVATGMSEYSGRYRPLAKFLAGKGFACYLHDHPGQGPEEAQSGTLGVYPPGTWEKSVARLHARVRDVRERTSSLPGQRIILFGHSWGSFLVQDFVRRWPMEIAGVVLSGSNGWESRYELLAALFVARLGGRFRGPNQPARFLDRFVFGGFNRRFRPNRTRYDWVSRDPERVLQYAADPLCGGVASHRFFAELFGGLLRLWYGRPPLTVPPDLPVLVVSGTDDALSGPNNSGIHRLVNRLQQKGAARIELEFFPGGRHELLGPSDFPTLTARLLTWLDSSLDVSRST
jgi:alpha-beta hydrolase superfamily lysophospholipase